MTFIETDQDKFKGGFKLFDDNLFDDNLFGLEGYISTAKEFENDTRMAINWSLEEPIDLGIKMLKFLFDKCDEAIKLFCLKVNYNPEYEPDDAEIEKYASNPVIGNGNFDVDSLIEELFYESRDKLILKYEKDHSKEINAYKELRRLYFYISKNIYYLEKKEILINKALNSGTDNKTKLLEDYFTCENKDNIIVKFKKLIRNTKGRNVAKYILALQIKGYIDIQSRAKLYDAIRLEFGYNIGSEQGINRYMNKECFDKNELDIAIKQFV